MISVLYSSRSLQEKEYSINVEFLRENSKRNNLERMDRMACKEMGFEK